MFKRCLILILILSAAISLCACGSAEKQRPPITDPAVLELLKARPVPAFDQNQSEKMACFLYANRALIFDGTLFCFDYDQNYEPVLAAYTLDESFPDNFRILADNCVPQYITMLDGRLYYINSRNGSALESVCPDGSDRTTLFGFADFLQSAAGKLWFCDENGRFCSVFPDGSAPVIHIAQACAYPFVIGETIIYQNEDDGERLHLLFRSDGTDVALSSTAAYAPFIIGRDLYYTRKGYGGQDLFRMSLDGMSGTRFATGNIVGAAEPFCTGEQWGARFLTDEDRIRQWTVPVDMPDKVSESDTRGWRRFEFTGGGFTVETLYNPDGRVSCLMLSSPDGQQLRFLAGELKY